MSAQLCKTANRWFLLFMTSLAVILASVKENAAVVVKRDTTLDNVKAMYNRFVNPSTGKAKYVKDGKNACSLDLPPSVASTPGMLHVAASKDDFQSSLGCGVCLQVTGNGKPAAADLDGAPPVKGTLNAIVIDQDDTLSQGDLALLPPESGSGLWEINFKAVDCPTGLGATGFIQFRFTGSNEMYFKLQAMNAKVPVAGIEAFQRVNSKWFCLTKTPDNYFSSEGMAAVSFPLMVRLTSIMNEQLEATIEALKNDVVIVSDIQFSNTDVRGGTPEGIKCYGQGNRPPSDEGDEAFCVSKEDGIYADQEDETAFYVCEGEKTTKKFCPTGLKFNPTISSCDVPEDVPFVGNEAGLPGKFQSKVITRWTSLPGNAGLKVLSVGGPEEHEKHLDDAVLNTQKPHKILSINIFNGAHATAKTAADNGNVQKDKEQSNLQNNTATETRVSQVNTKARQSPVAETNFQDDLHNGTNLTTGENSAMSLQNGTNLTTGENSAMSVSDNTDLGISDNLKPSNDNPQSSLPMQSSLNPLSQANRGTDAQLNSSQLLFPSHLSVSSTLSESAMNSDKNLQNVQETGSTSSLTAKTSSLKGHRGFSHHKVFAINLFRLQPKAPTMHNRYENTRLSGDQVDPAYQFKNEPILSNKVSVHPLYAQMNDGEVLNNPGTKSEHKYQEQNQLGDSSVSKLLQNKLPTTGEATARPLHFKLKVQVDKSGKHPGINCTLSECPEQQNGLVMGSSVHPNYNNDLQEKKNDSEFRITLNTVGSDPLKDTLHLIPNQASDFQRLPSQINVVKYPSNLQDTHVQLLNQTLEQFPQHINGNTTLKVSAVSQELKNDLEVQDNGSGETADTMKGEQVDKQSEHENDTNIHLQNASTDNRSAQDNGGFIVARLPLSRKYESYVKNPALQIAAYNDSKLENTRFLPMKENVASFERAHENISDQTQNNNISANGRFTKLLTTLHQDTLTSALPDNTIKNKLHGKEQLDKENFFQAQTQPLGNRPQMKIILKNPGKLGTFINHITELKKRSGARGHIVQILKSLIDKPLKVGLKNKDVVSKLSNLMKKSISGKTPRSDNDWESIKDSGSIAQSILEANKEYLDDVAMQGMIFSDADLETENMTDIADSIKQSHKYLQPTLETPQWENTTGAEEDELQDPSPDQGAVKQAWYNDEHLMNQGLDDGDDSSSASGMGDSNSTVAVNSSKAAKSHRLDDHKEVSLVIVGQADGASEVNAYRGGMLKSKLDPKLKSFCIGERSGIYTNPFDQKSFVICSNGLSEERECPSSMLFNSKEKICDIPDKMYNENRK